MRKGASFTNHLTPMQLIELDACTQCGECLKFCPIQDVNSKPSISPSEKIRVFKEFIRATEGLKTRLFGSKDIDRKLLEDFTKAVFECTTCGACGQHCSVGIFTQRLWPILRKEMVRRGFGPIGGQAKMPEVIKNTGNPYNLPARDRFNSWFPEDVKVAEKADVAYYAGCTGAYSAQPMVRGDVLVLKAIGEPFTMLLPEEEVCCGFPLFASGQHDMLEDLTKRLVHAYGAKGVKLLLSSCPCCVNIMSRDWPIFYGKELPFKIRHMTQFAAEALKSGKLKIREGLSERLIYHDPCYLSRGVGITEEPRIILKSIPGVQLIEFDRYGVNSKCCGAGGAARKVYPENANAIGRSTIDEAVKKGVDRLIFSCPACYAQVNEGMQNDDKRIKITDIMELLSGFIA
ncbi:MAG TPA: (Fe-S)-binding protein [Candidatus Sulfobium mesophilum]|nr:(Fe-S)-binding protein [Candidatus Sulfobium mesophilum]